MSEIAYGNRASTGTIVAASIAGGAVVGLVDAAANRGFEIEFGETANVHDFDLREALRAEFPAAVNRRNALPQKVSLAKDLAALSGEEMAAANGDARFYLSVANYGFGAMPFSKSLTPFPMETHDPETPHRHFPIETRAPETPSRHFPMEIRDVPSLGR